jgi:hypothetical protein
MLEKIEKVFGNKRTMFRFMSGISKIRVGVGRWIPILPNGARKYPPRSPKPKKLPINKKEK